MALMASPAVLRAGDLLAHLGSRPTETFTVTELARLLAIPRATCDSLLLGLSARGFVQRNADLSYQLGAACVTLGEAARTAHPALRAASAHAEALARAQDAVAAVCIRVRDETRVASVFDFGPPFGIRTRPGDAITLVPPFGASFVAWDDERHIQEWLDRAEPALTASEADRYRAALQAVRERGYSITIGSGRQPALATALERLADELDAHGTPGTSYEAIRTISHSEHLASEVDPQGTTRLTQISAPVFDHGQVAASIMLLGPGHELSAQEIAELGRLVLAAATGATQDIGGRR